LAHHQKRSLLVAAVAGIVGSAGLLVAYAFLGFATGVIAICGGAPIWWVNVYFVLAFTLPAISAWFAVRVRRSYLQRYAPAFAELLHPQDRDHHA
jgi:hypothetical protein